MKSFLQFIAESEEVQHSHEGGRSHFKKADGTHLSVDYHNQYFNEKGSRLRDPRKTKHHITVYQHHPDGHTSEAAYKAVTRAESKDFHERKQKAQHALVRKIKKSHGVDITKAFHGLS